MQGFAVTVALRHARVDPYGNNACADAASAPTLPGHRCNIDGPRKVGQDVHKHPHRIAFPCVPERHISQIISAGAGESMRFSRPAGWRNLVVGAVWEVIAAIGRLRAKLDHPYGDA